MAKTSAKISFGYVNPLNEQIGEQFFKNLPRVPAVYYFLDHEKSPLYVGKAVDLKRRLAKPGTVGENIIEMLDHAHSIRFEEHPSDEAAIRREEELIRSLRPPYNIAMNWDAAYLHLGIKFSELPAKNAERDAIRIQFNLGSVPPPEGFTNYGCFRHRGSVKTGYSALLRLIFAATNESPRLSWPAKICRTSPAYVYATSIPRDFEKPIRHFLEGRNQNFLQVLMSAILANETLPRHLYLAVQRDFALAQQFFKLGPQDTRKLAKLAATAVPLAQSVMDQIVRVEFRQNFC